MAKPHNFLLKTMESFRWRFGVVWLCLILCVFNNYCAAGEPRSQSSQEAYVTLLYGDEFLLGVRVLGKSIRDTGATKDMVVLVSDGVSKYAKQLLQVLFLNSDRKSLNLFVFLGIWFLLFYVFMNLWPTK